MEFFFKIYGDLPKQGPGSEASTLKALKAIPDYQSLKNILDLGCGTGRHTITLAQNTSAQITALEYYDQQIESLKKNISQAQISERVNILQGDMGNLNFSQGEFDLIWSESSIYNIGFEKGLKEWNPFIKEAGYLAVSEALWLSESPSQELKKWWEQEYPQMLSLDENKNIIQYCGYDLIDSFILPQNDWWEGYYEVLEKRLEDYDMDTLSVEERELVTASKAEIDIFKKFSDQYGYAFFVMKKIAK